jgi:cytochrome c biogenesis protein CcmG/thiol:disulfide interchange protein DsbE
MKVLLRLSTRMAMGIAAGAMCLVAAATMLHGQSTEAKSRKAAPEFALKDAQSAPVKLSDYRGKVVLLNFWATWCHGCKLEIPWFMEFEKKYKGGGLEVIGVAMDDDGWKSVKPYAEEKKMNYAVVTGDEDLGKLYGLDSMPMTVLIDREGRIAATYSGMVDREKCESEIRMLLQEGGKSAAK